MTRKPETTQAGYTFVPGWPGIILETTYTGEWSYVDGLRELDPTWQYIDANGHAHLVVRGDLPTLEWVPEPCTMGHGPDCTTEGYYVCRVCRVRQQPGTRPAQPSYEPGPTIYRLTIPASDGTSGVETVYEFGDDEWDQLRARFETAAAEVLGDRIVERTMWPR